MLDQNTDRMWFVIGAVIVGAAIIFIANGTLPTLFASVSDNFGEASGKAQLVIGDLYPNDRTYEEILARQDELASTDNLLLSSRYAVPHITDEYYIEDFYVKEEPIPGEYYSMTVKGSNAYKLRPHYSGPWTGTKQTMRDIGNGFYVSTLKWPETDPRDKEAIPHLRLYNGGSWRDMPTEAMTVEWMVLVKGTVPLLEHRE